MTLKRIAVGKFDVLAGLFDITLNPLTDAGHHGIPGILRVTRMAIRAGLLNQWGHSQLIISRDLDKLPLVLIHSRLPGLVGRNPVGLLGD
jgi:hypothetical protein